MRLVLFLGNCQAEALASVYRARAAAEIGDSVSFLSSVSRPSDSDVQLIQDADVIIEQVFDFKPTVALEDFTPNARVVRFPTVSGAFLWPFSGRAHPRNASFPFLRGGPYPAELGDGFLNRMIVERVDPDDAVARYLELDVAAIANLDQRYEIIIRQQRSRDALADLPTADVMERLFRDEHIFFSPYHPGPRLLRLLFAGILEKIGVDSGFIGRMQRVPTRSPLADRWLPIHPAVARHFGLSYVADNQAYRFLEGSFTFVEWAMRYMRFEWNESLAEGADLPPESDAGIEKLQIGLLRSPNSARGYWILAQRLHRRKRFEYAAAALRRAVGLDPGEPIYKSSLGHVLAAMGDHATAVLAFRQAIELESDDADLHSSLSHSLCVSGRSEEAVLPARLALELDPHRRGAGHLGDVHAQCGQWPQAELAYRQALELEPGNPTWHAGLARALAAQGRFGVAIGEMRRAVVLDPENPRLALQCWHLLIQRECDLERTEPDTMELGNGADPEPAELAPYSAVDA